METVPLDHNVAFYVASFHLKMNMKSSAKELIRCLLINSTYKRHCHIIQNEEEPPNIFLYALHDMN